MNRKSPLTRSRLPSSIWSNSANRLLTCDTPSPEAMTAAIPSSGRANRKPLRSTTAHVRLCLNPPNSRAVRASRRCRRCPHRRISKRESPCGASESTRLALKLYPSLSSAVNNPHQLQNRLIEPQTEHLWTAVEFHDAFVNSGAQTITQPSNLKPNKDNRIISQFLST